MLPVLLSNSTGNAEPAKTLNASFFSDSADLETTAGNYLTEASCKK